MAPGQADFARIADIFAVVKDRVMSARTKSVAITEVHNTINSKT